MTEPVLLVIDDEEPVRLAVTDILELSHWKVLTAASGEEGLDVYRQHQAEIDLVLLDLSMPGLSGDETFQRLRQIDPQVRVILSSGYDPVEVARRFSGQAHVGFIQKPYDDVKLAREVARYMDEDQA
ncbi:MAG: response regulator [Anaerolineae bacterium]